MLTTSSRNLSIYLGLSLISASVLALQVIFTRIFSIMIWYHFTYLVIGVALLGGGAAGTYLALRRWESATIAQRIGKLAVLFSLSIVLDLFLITRVQFDPLGGKAALLPALIGLAIYFAALFTTFFLGGLTVSGVFSMAVRHAHGLYFADLLGASVSTLVVVWLVQWLGGPSAMVLVAGMALVAALLFGVQLPRRFKLGLPLIALAEAMLFAVITFGPSIQVPVPQSKELGWALNFTQAERPEYTIWNPVARVDVLPIVHIAEPMIVGGVSSTYQYPAAGYDVKLVTLDGTSMTGLYRFDGGDLSAFEFLKHAVISAPYVATVSAHPTTLNIGVGGGLDILLARLYGAAHITAIDLNTDLVALLKGDYADFTGRLADEANTTIEAAEGRSFLIRDNQQYDIIQGIGLDNFAALSGGAYVLSESYIYTVEAFELALQRLTPDGLFAWTRSTNSPPREMVRLTALAAEALRKLGVEDVTRHIAIVVNETGDAATLLVSRAPFRADAMQRLRDWAGSNRFAMLYDPLERLDTVYDHYLHAPDPRAFEASYIFHIYPVTDDNPFFFNYFKWTDFQIFREDQGDINTRLPIGNLILIAMLSFSLVAAITFILVPLLRNRRSGLITPHAMPMLVYFSALGVGYIFIEIVLIQRFTLFIGYPTHAITTTIFSLLFFSALGSLGGGRLARSPRALRIVLLSIVAVIPLYVVGLPPLFEAFLPLSDVARILVSVALIAPLAFLMGMPFPTGLRQIGGTAPSLVPWAWGMNGIFSVLGSALVILISQLTNFTIAFACGALMYGVATLVSSALWKTQVLRVSPAHEIAVSHNIMASERPQ